MESLRAQFKSFQKYPQISIPASIILLLMIVSKNKNFFTWLTLVLGPIIVLFALFIEETKYSNFVKSLYFRIIQLVGGILPIIGMYFGKFSAPFKLPFPFGYYFLLAIIIVWTVMAIILRTENEAN